MTELDSQRRIAIDWRGKTISIVRPHLDSFNGKVWMIADQLYEASGKQPTGRQVTKAGAMYGMNRVNIKGTFWRWRMFNNEFHKSALYHGGKLIDPPEAMGRKSEDVAYTLRELQAKEDGATG